MNTPRFTSCLSAAAALLFAASVQAGELSMDAGGMFANSGARTSDAGSNRDCASAPKSIADDSERSPARHVPTASAAIADSVSADDDTGVAGNATSTGSSPADSPISVPIKARGNRWQSLVPGAIK
ncbi:MAG TPA: hypothetical protein PKC03_09000 [Dokdonella sp.]|jgi:hypothetical protein|nr:hypothetical protein [Dokdonella sp.]